MRRLAVLLAALFVKLRFAIFLVVVAAVVWVGVTLPALSGKSQNAVSSLVPKGSPAVKAERISAERFAFPVITRTLVVVRNPRGLSTARQASLVALAARLSLQRVPGYRDILGAVPLLNSVGAPPFSREHGTTAILYLYFRPSVSSGHSTRVAQRLATRVIGHRPGEFEGVTGGLPAQSEQSSLVEENLQWVQLATLLVVALAVALRFRAVGAAALTIGAVIGAYVVSERLVALLGRRGGIALPAEMGPVLVVLVMGVATDYSIFFLSRFRALMEQGSDARAATAAVLRQIAPVVVAAGVTVAAGTASLLVASLSFLRDFGPGLALAGVLAMLTAGVLVPAGLAVGGAKLFWPREPRSSHDPLQSRAAPGRQPSMFGDDAARQQLAPKEGSRYSPARLSARRPIIALTLAVVLVLAGASGLRQIAVGNELIAGLPHHSQAYRAYAQARHGFAPGVLAPAVLVVTAPGIGGERPQLARLQTLLAAQPELAEVLGPRQQPLPARFGLVVSRDGNAARYLLFSRSDPIGARGLSDIRALEGRLPMLLRQAGLARAHALLGGDSALSADIVDSTLTDLGRVTPVMLAAIFLVLAIYLRALVAPGYLILTSLLAVLSALGLTVYVMQDLLGYGQTTYYVIFTVAVLLVSLGSDYNVFLIGRIWQQGRRRPLRDAVELAGARAARPIAVAGLVLASAFALLAIVPVRAFREIAFAMAAGLIVDAFIVRAILVPALVVLVGPRSAWPRTLPGEQAPEHVGGPVAQP